MLITPRANTGRLITRRSLTIGLGATVAAITQAAILPRAVSAQPSGCGAPAEMPDGWLTSLPEAVGLDSRRLCALTGWLDNFRATNIHSVLVARRGTLAFEHYRKGDDQQWGVSLPSRDHGPAVMHDMRSITKSVTSLLGSIHLTKGPCKRHGSADRPALAPSHHGEVRHG